MQARHIIMVLSSMVLFAIALPAQAVGDVITRDNAGSLTLFEQIETENAAYSVTWTSDSTAIAYGLDNGDIEQMQITPTLTSLPPLQVGHLDSVTSVDISHDDQYVFSVSMDGTFNAWERATGRLLSSPGVNLQVPGAPFLTSVAAHPNNANLIAYTGQYNDVGQRQWNAVATNTPDLTGHPTWIFDVKYSPNGDYLATAGTDSTVRLWEFATGMEVRRDDIHTSRVYDVAFDRGGFLLVATGQDRLVTIRPTLVTGEPFILTTIPDLGRTDTVANAIDVGLNSDFVAVGDSNGILRLYSIPGPADSTTELLFEVDTGDDQIRDIEISPDGTMIAIAGFNRTVQIWNVPSLGVPPVAPPAPTPTESVAPLPVPPVPITGEFCTGAPPGRLEIGQRARVTFTDGLPLRLRSYPGETIIENMAEGLEFDIIGGPLCLDGFTWWQLELDSGVTGWSAEGDSDDYYIEPLLSFDAPAASLDISISGTVWHDICDNDTNSTGFCTTDAADLFIGDGFRATVEPVISDVTVGMSDSFCPPRSTDYQTTTAIDGTYSFTGLSTGDYCVFINPSLVDNRTILRPGQFTNLESIDFSTGIGYIQVSVTESNLVVTDIDFGWDFTLLP
jgi:WD40 repeat protein